MSINLTDFLKTSCFNQSREKKYCISVSHKFCLIMAEDLLVSIGLIRYIWHCFGFPFLWIKTRSSFFQSSYFPFLNEASKISFRDSIINFPQSLSSLIEILFQPCTLLESNIINSIWNSQKSQRFSVLYLQE